MEPLLLPFLVIQMEKNCGFQKSSRIKKEMIPMPQPEFKITYFDVRGVAEMSRMILAYSGQGFIDNRISFDEYFKNQRESIDFELPILEWNGKKLREPCSMARMLAKMTGLAGQTVWEQAQVDVLISILRDFNCATFDYVRFLLGLTTGNEEVFYNNHMLPAIKKYFPLLEKAASQSQSGFFLDSGISFVDFELANTVESLRNFHPSLLTPFPCLQSIADRVFAIPRLQNYLANRPKTAL